MSRTPKKPKFSIEKPMPFEDYEKFIMTALVQKRKKLKMILTTLNGPVVCKLCSFESDDSGECIYHLELHEKEEIDGIGGADNLFEFKCPYCSYQVTHKAVMNTHIKQHQREEVYHCSVCSYATKRKYDMPKHMISHCSKDSIKFECCFCSYATNRKPDMPKHMLTHYTKESVTTYKCALCPYTTKRKPDMPKHMLGHCEKGVKMYKCNECPYQTKRKNDLPKHLLCHKSINEVEYYHCDRCDYRTKRKGDLSKHTVAHSDSQVSFLCPICPYLSKRKNDLNKHIITHSDKCVAGIFKCMQCNFGSPKVNLFARHCFSHKVNPEFVKIEPEDVQNEYEEEIMEDMDDELVGEIEIEGDVIIENLELQSLL